MKNLKITEAMSIEDQENIIKNLKMILDQLPAAISKMRDDGGSEQKIKGFIDNIAEKIKNSISAMSDIDSVQAARKELPKLGVQLENLNEGKKKKMSYMAELAEIDKQSAIVAMEAKINKLDEMIEAKNARLNMVNEDENLSELIDKKRVKEMQREIKILEKEKSKMERMYEKMHGKKKKEMVDEEEKMNEGGYGNYEEDDSKMEEGMHDKSEEDDMKEGKHDEIDEAHCSEEDDTDSMNEEIARWQKLAGISVIEITTPNNPTLKDKDGKEIKQHDELEVDATENTPEKYISTLKKLGYNVDMDWYNSQKK